MLIENMNINKFFQKIMSLISVERMNFYNYIIIKNYNFEETYNLIRKILYFKIVVKFIYFLYYLAILFLF